MNKSVCLCTNRSTAIIEWYARNHKHLYRRYETVLGPPEYRCDCGRVYLDAPK